jgi:phosphopentomutase
LNNFFIIILDGVGVGELPDAHIYNDQGSNTLANIADSAALNLSNLGRLGLGNISPIKGVPPAESPLASYGKMNELSKGKDSTTGHWEIGGLYIDKEFDYFPEGFPDPIIEKFKKLTGCKGILGNIAASGTEIIKELGAEHVKTGFPIIYTSADSVFQIAAHEEIIPLKELYRICKITRDEVLNSPLHVGRVIARPFIGEPGNFKRTVNRKDYSLDPPGKTILDLCFENGITTCAIGKINDLYNHRGIKIVEESKSNDEGIKKIIKSSSQLKGALIFANLVDFDVYYGHRNDVDGFAKALQDFDTRLPGILDVMDATDYLVITADHGNDPTTPSTDHSREYVPLLFYNKIRKAENLQIRRTFSDVAKTAAEFFTLQNDYNAVSFLRYLRKI